MDQQDKNKNPKPCIISESSAVGSCIFRMGDEVKVAPSPQEVEMTEINAGGEGSVQFCLFYGDAEASSPLARLDHLTCDEKDLLDCIYTFAHFADKAITDKTVPLPPLEIDLAEIAKTLGLKRINGKVGPIANSNSQGWGNKTYYTIITRVIHLAAIGIIINATKQARAWGMDVKSYKYASTLLRDAKIDLIDYNPIPQDDGSIIERKKQCLYISAFRNEITKEYSYTEAMPLYRYAEDFNAQLIPVEIAWFKIPGNNTDLKRAVNAYLRRVILVSRRKREKSKTIAETTVRNRIWGGKKEVTKKAWTKRLDLINEQLKQWQDLGLITGYEYVPSASKTYNDAKWVIYN